MLKMLHLTYITLNFDIHLCQYLVKVVADLEKLKVIQVSKLNHLLILGCLIEFMLQMLHLTYIIVNFNLHFCPYLVNPFGVIHS